MMFLVQLYAVACSGVGRRSLVKTLHSSLSTEFWTHCVFSGAQRSTQPRYQIEELKILNISFLLAGIEPTTCRVHSYTLGHSQYDKSKI